MSAIYDNWERLVAAVLKKEEIWQLFHDQSRSPSILSEASDFDTSFDWSSQSLDDPSFEFPRLRGSSRRHRKFPRLVLFSDFVPAAIDLKGSHLFSTRFLGRGSLGAAYVVQVAAGQGIVVKWLKPMAVSEVKFRRHMEIIGNVSHENVVPLRAYYSYDDQRLVLYDYYSRGSVCALLYDMWDSESDTWSVLALKHGETGLAQSSLSWASRLKIAIGAARGVAELHAQNGGKLVHGNIKASNIFLNSRGYGCVTDCYAPEVTKTKMVSQASDVYSFGVLMLELLTGKPSVNAPGGPSAVDLVKVVKSRKKDSEVLYPDLWRDRSSEEQMIKMLQVGLRCVKTSIKKRPRMSEVVKMLEEIGVSEPVNHAHLPEKLVFIEDENATFDLGDISRAHVEVLGKGTLETCYKTRLENGEVVVLKSLNNVIVPVENILEHVEIVGRIRHNNVAKLRGYCCSKDVKLLVLEYYKHGSLFELLHGGTPIDWETRLKIMLGAARGVSHIHGQEGGKLVHGNIKSSNIFFDEQKDVLVSDAGLWRLMVPARDRAYCAPEVSEAREVSQASDVYSFGVVMLEILCRKPAPVAMKEVWGLSSDEWAQSVRRDKRGEGMRVRLLQMAMDCTGFKPEGRPTMARVTQMLENISRLYNEPWAAYRLERVLEFVLPKLADVK